MNAFNDQRVALITGASSGIGEALARELAERKFRLVLLARRDDRLRALAKNLEGITSVRWQICDVTNPADLQSAVILATREFGRIDLVFANAGFGVSGTLEKLSIDDYRRQFETNIFGVINTLKATFESLKKAKGSACILGSVMSYVSFPGSTPYVMSKFAVRGLSEVVYHEWREEGVSVTLACPGVVESEIRLVDNQGRLHPGVDPVNKRFVMSAHECAQKIISATLARRREVVITLHGKVGVFLIRHFPGFFHWVVTALKLRGGRQKSKDVQAANWGSGDVM